MAGLATGVAWDSARCGCFGVAAAVRAGEVKEGACGVMGDLGVGVPSWDEGTPACTVLAAPMDPARRGAEASDSLDG